MIIAIFHPFFRLSWPMLYSCFFFSIIESTDTAAAALHMKGLLHASKLQTCIDLWYM